MLISEKTQLPSLRKVNAVEHVSNVIHNVVTNSTTKMINLLCAGA